jgi:hypothetical protein
MVLPAISQEAITSAGRRRREADVTSPRFFFTADWHVGHHGILSPRMHAPRPFASIEKHDETLVARWSEVVGPQDTVWHLGDFSYRCTEAYVLGIFRRLNGRRLLVRGNHDKVAARLPWDGPVADVARVVVQNQDGPHPDRPAGDQLPSGCDPWWPGRRRQAVPGAIGGSGVENPMSRKWRKSGSGYGVDCQVMGICTRLFSCAPRRGKGSKTAPASDYLQPSVGRASSSGIQANGSTAHCRRF